MSPELNESSVFSQCSLSSMAASIAGARGICVGTAHYVDLALELPPSPYSAQTNGTFSLPMTVRSLGNVTATNVQLRVNFPALFRPAGRDTGRRELLGGGPHHHLRPRRCRRQRGARARSARHRRSLGSFPVSALLTADDDLHTGNNSGNVQVGIQSGVDVGRDCHRESNQCIRHRGGRLHGRFDVITGPLASHGGTLSINIGGIPVESFTAGPSTCSIDPFETGF